MSNVKQILSNFKLFSAKDTSSERIGEPLEKKATPASYLATVIIVLVIGWVVYKYKSVALSLFQNIIDKLRLSAYLTKKGEIATTQPSIGGTSNGITLDSVAQSLGIVTAPKETA